jgi:hypothetical protein
VVLTHHRIISRGLSSALTREAPSYVRLTIHNDLITLSATCVLLPSGGLFKPPMTILCTPVHVLPFTARAVSSCALDVLFIYTISHQTVFSPTTYYFWAGISGELDPILGVGNGSWDLSVAQDTLNIRLGTSGTCLKLQLPPFLWHSAYRTNFTHLLYISPHCALIRTRTLSRIHPSAQTRLSHKCCDANCMHHFLSSNPYCTFSVSQPCTHLHAQFAFAR